MGAAKPTRTCKRCKVEKDKYSEFYSPTDDVCIACNPDVNFIKKSKRLAKERGPAALEERMGDYLRRARLTREVLRGIKARSE